MSQGQPSIHPILAGLVLALLVLLSVAMAWRAARERKPRVVCFGDSLTSCGGPGGRYADFLAQSLPRMLVINKGVSGETLADGRRRFRRDVLDLKPVAMVIALGANDWKRNERPIEALSDDMEFMVRAAREAGIEVVIAGVFGEHPDPAGRALRQRHEGPVGLAPQIHEMEREIAGKYGCGYVPNMQMDLNTPRCWDGSGHPSPEGNRLIAARILAALKEALTRREGSGLGVQERQDESRSE
jgi:lysophospholipase L1-like esterase